jgi:hypothetical protein
MIRIALALTGTLAALAFCAATAHAEPDAPTPIGPEFNLTEGGSVPWLDEQILYHQDFSLLNAPAETFQGVVHFEYAEFGSGSYHPTLENYNVSVEQDMAGNVPLGEQYNDFSLGGGWDEVYNTIGGTPEAFFTTPFGDHLDFPTWFVEAVGPSFFEPMHLLAPSLEATTLPAADLPVLAGDLSALLAGLW